MKKLSLALLSVTCFLNVTLAQNYKKIFYKEQTIENNDLKISISDAVATAAGIKFRLRIYNKTNEYIIYKPSESIFKIGGKDHNPVEEWLVIRPNDDDSKVIDLKGPDYIVAGNFNFVMEGLYKFSTNSKGVSAPDFKLPASQNDFKAGGFDVGLMKSKQETARTDAVFNVKYVGDKVGIFEPNKVAMKMPDGKEYANHFSDRKPVIFAKGKENKIAVAWKDIPTSSGDMQKVEMTILWRDAFKEITPDKMMPQTLTIMFDEETTKAKNK